MVLVHVDCTCLLLQPFQSSDLASIDSTSQKIVVLFHPRKQRWKRHFHLNGALIEGITSSGRATVALLHMNDPERVAYRLGLIEIGHYPPDSAVGETIPERRLTDG